MTSSGADGCEAYARSLQLRERSLTLALQAVSARKLASARLDEVRARRGALAEQSRAALRASRERLDGRLRVVLADRDPEMTSFLRFLLEDVSRGFRIVGTALDGAAAVAAVVALQPRVVVLDDLLPVVPLADSVRDMREFAPQTLIALHLLPGGPYLPADLVLDRTGRALDVPRALLAACGRG